MHLCKLLMTAKKDTPAHARCSDLLTCTYYCFEVEGRGFCVNKLRAQICTE